MMQDAIWEYYQNDAKESFAASDARSRYLLRCCDRSGKILNIGVGGGIFEALAIRAGLNVYSLDPSERTIERLKSELGMGENAQVGYGQNIPFADSSFQNVVVSEVFEHLPPEIVTAMLAEIWRVLVPSGALIGTVPAREDLRRAMFVCIDCGSLVHRWGHEQSFDCDRMGALLEPDFTDVTLIERPFISWRELNWKGKIVGATKLFLWRMGVHGSGENIVFTARKSGGKL